MIQNFSYINDKNLKIELNNIGKMDIAQIENYKQLFFKIYNSETLGLFWKYRDDCIEKIEVNTRITGSPSVDMNYIISIHRHKNDPDFPGSQYLIIYNADGSLHKKIFVPKLISELSKQHYKKIKYPQTISFSTILWKEIEKNKIVLVVKIGFGWDWYEERILNAETGEFGECVGSGRF